MVFDKVSEFGAAKSNDLFKLAQMLQKSIEIKQVMRVLPARLRLDLGILGEVGFVAAALSKVRGLWSLY